MYQTRYRIAGISIIITAPNELTDDDAFHLYREIDPKACSMQTECPVPDFYEEISQMSDSFSSVEQNPSVPSDSTQAVYFIDLEVDASLPEYQDLQLFQNELNTVFDQQPPLHFFRPPFAKENGAWDLLGNTNRKVLHICPAYAPYFDNSTGVFNAVGFERILHHFQRYLYHCSYVDFGGRAVLFSAPSGGGKTTQGKLWEQYAGAEMINGDRAVLEASENSILCHGLPIAGSSHVFINRTLPLAAIFTLEKAPENSLVRLKGKAAVLAVYSQLTINLWDAEFVQDALDFSIAVASRVPIYRLSCTISQEAVLLAQKQL